MKNKFGYSVLEIYLKFYNNYRDFFIDICEDIYVSEFLLDFSFCVGVFCFIINIFNFVFEEIIF